MPNPRNKPQARNLLDGTGVTYSNLLRFLENATKDLETEGKEDAAFYFGQFHDWLRNHYHPSKSFIYESRILGL